MSATPEAPSPVTALTDQLLAYQRDLHTFAAWVAEQDWTGLPVPYLDGAPIAGQPSVRFSIMCQNAEELAAVARLMAHGAPIGEVRKEMKTYGADGAAYVWVTRRFGSIMLRAWAERNRVCEAVEVGTETVEVPDPAAPRVTVERPVIEWRCSPLLGEVA